MVRGLGVTLMDESSKVQYLDKFLKVTIYLRIRTSVRVEIGYSTMHKSLSAPSVSHGRLRYERACQIKFLDEAPTDERLKSKEFINDLSSSESGDALERFSLGERGTVLQGARGQRCFFLLTPSNYTVRRGARSDAKNVPSLAKSWAGTCATKENSSPWPLI